MICVSTEIMLGLAAILWLEIKGGALTKGRDCNRLCKWQWHVIKAKRRNVRAREGVNGGAEVKTLVWVGIRDGARKGMDVARSDVR